MAYPVTVHRLVAQASMVVAIGAAVFGCASGSESSEDLPTPVVDSGTGADTSVTPEDTGGADVATDTGGSDVATDTGPGPCKTNADCASDPAGKFCLVGGDGGKSYCVPCLPAPYDECGAGTYCSETTYTCESGCKTTADCSPTSGDAGADGGSDGGDASSDAGTDSGTTASLTCDTVKHRCVGCVADTDCTAGFLCDRPTGTCVPGCNTTHPCATGKECCSGSCFDTQKDVKNCGSCGNVCPTPSNGTAGCTAGACGIGTCNTGFADCNTTASDGCETSTLTDKNNCGGCGSVCALANANSACTAGSCTIASCTGVFDDCDKIASNGCEANLQTNSNCGGCGKLCAISNGTGTCSTGTCRVATCNTGFGDCDDNPTTGCETNLTSSLTNCGTCGTTCSVANGTPACVTGTCKVQSCSPPFADCNGNYADGCESDSRIDVNNCGGCGKACSNTNGIASCAVGACGIACNAGFGNCDGSVVNGCEKNLTNDVANCNACGVTCALTANSTASICKPSGTAGACAVGSCAPGAYDRDGVYSNGCECVEDPIGNTCGAAMDLGSVPLGTTKTQNGNLVGAGDTDEDWFKITFPVAASCSWKPHLSLSSVGTVAKMQIYTGCAATPGSGNLSCNSVGDVVNSNANHDNWDIRLPGCLDMTGVDPTPDNGPFISVPTTIYVRIVRAGSFAGCYPYTLTYGNG